MPRKAKLPLAVTMGDPAGIGGDVTLKTWLRRDEGLAPFLVIDDPKRLKELAVRLGLEVPVAPVDDAAAALEVFHRALPVLPLELPAAALPGHPDPSNAPATVRAIETAVRLARDRRAAAVVTNPINKRVLHQAGFPHPGHTEFLAALAGDEDGSPPQPVMMLACSQLRVVPVTVHLSLRDAVATLTTEAIVTCGRITAESLRRYFGRPRPRLAVAALNPHAGEGGDLGREEIDIITPAVETLRDEGLEVSDPAPADTLFHAEARTRYDAALCMYHDQALIPLKTLDFHGGVNITLGLPFIRTSPDHGTAYDLAGTGRANESSLMAALRLAAEMAVRTGHV